MYRGKIGEGNGTLLQYSCLENPMDGGAWKAAVHGIAEGQTRLCDPIDGSPPAPPSLGFSRQEHWSGLPFPSPMHESEK